MIKNTSRGYLDEKVFRYFIDYGPEMFFCTITYKVRANITHWSFMSNKHHYELECTGDLSGWSVEPIYRLIEELTINPSLIAGGIMEVGHHPNFIIKTKEKKYGKEHQECRQKAKV